MARGTNKAKLPTKSKPFISTRDRSGTTTEGPKDEQVSHHAPLDLQQKCINIFRDTLKPNSDEVGLLQEVKGHLYNRDFASAFGKEEYLRIYSSRWSPSRALGYLELLLEVQNEFLNGVFVDENGGRTVSVACLGGGAGAEVVALGGWLHLLQNRTDNTNASSIQINSRCFDLAPWGNIVKPLQKATITPPELSKYASAAVKEANTALLPEQIYTVDFEQLDILSLDEEKSKTVFSGHDLVTIMFTLNELYATSMPKTQKMLALLTAHLHAGAHLLVVDSPGSYSTVLINGAEKRYPMQWLLDYTLIGAREKDQKRPVWQKVVADQSRWFRLPPGLKYPIELENMRYQMHLYVKLADSEDG